LTAEAAAKRVLVVVPAYNEAGSVEAVVRRIFEAAPVDVLVVDDGSKDRTSHLARRAGAQVARLPFNMGVGAAMRTGFRYAERQGYDAVVQVDGDGQHDPTFLPQLLEALDTADVVIGARFAGVGAYAVSGPRAWAMRVLSFLLSRITGTQITDATSGFRGANRRAIGVFATHYPAEYLGDTVESLVIARRLGLIVRQVPVAMRPREAGRASQGLGGATLYLGRALAAVLLALVRRWPYEDPETQ
jgi:glycosyltransferase involved in cell wall biosynthesis